MWWHWIAVAAVVLVVYLVVLILVEPGLRYRVTAAPCPIHSEEFLHLLGTLSDAQVHQNSRIGVLANGQVFYQAELAAIRGAQRSINLEAFIFRDSKIGREFVAVLAERAKAGVKVKLVLDAIGNLTTPMSLFGDLVAAGGLVRWYQPLRWYLFKRLNNRTHRELLIVDGQTGFIGGAGINDWWLSGTWRGPAWRDTVCRVTGDLVIALQSTFAENWLESSDEILMGTEYFPTCVADCPRLPLADSDCAAQGGLVVVSTPSAARSTRARILFQMLLASARKSIHISSPYFLPDRSLRGELIRAARDRGVKVRVLTPGRLNNHPTTRLASRRRYGELLAAGIEIWEYQPSMMHNKCLVVDGVWSVVGSTNFDNRSFGLNDEVNLAVLGQELAARLDDDFERDIAQSRAITYDDWSSRPFTERLLATLLIPLDRQE
jgi:cardiolipin synthase